MSQSLCLTIDSLKLAIARQADGNDANPEQIVNLDDLEAASVTMLRPGRNEGRN